jgi:hypothetical protein
MYTDTVGLVFGSDALRSEDIDPRDGEGVKIGDVWVDDDPNNWTDEPSG